MTQTSRKCNRAVLAPVDATTLFRFVPTTFPPQPSELGPCSRGPQHKITADQAGPESRSPHAPDPSRRSGRIKRQRGSWGLRLRIAHGRERMGQERSLISWCEGDLSSIIPADVVCAAEEYRWALKGTMFQYRQRTGANKRGLGKARTIPVLMPRSSQTSRNMMALCWRHASLIV